jgi:hypothetical protein
MEEVPKYEHNCKRCVFLGRYMNTSKGRDGESDLYYCAGEPTAIERYGNDGSNYYSGLCFMNANPAIMEAVIRAMKMGLISNKIYETEIEPYLNTVFRRV